jgi:hypothetical protein
MITIDDIVSNNNWTCARCGTKITVGNYTGWEVFVDGKTTQPICKFCDIIESLIPAKKAEDKRVIVWEKNELNQ